MISRTELQARRRGLRELHNRLEVVTQGVLDPAIAVGDIEPFQKEARFAKLRKGTVDYRLERTLS